MQTGTPEFSAVAYRVNGGDIRLPGSYPFWLFHIHKCLESEGAVGHRGHEAVARRTCGGTLSAESWQTLTDEY